MRSDASAASGSPEVAQVVDLSDLRHLLRQRELLVVAAADVNQRLDAVTGELLAAMGDSAVALVDGREVVRQSRVTTTRLDQTKLKHDYPEVVAVCMKESSYVKTAWLPVVVAP